MVSELVRIVEERMKEVVHFLGLDGSVLEGCCACSESLLKETSVVSPFGSVGLESHRNIPFHAV